MKIGIMDFSSTALSLLVADISKDSVEYVVNLRRSVSILDYLTEDGKLSKRGIERVVDSALYLVKAAKRVGVERFKMISTASMRLISNYREVSSQIEGATGLDIEALDGKAEAYADYVANRSYSMLGSALLLDVAGASAELADLEDGNMNHMHSLYMGPLVLFKRFKGMYPDKDDAKKVKKHVRKLLDKNKVYNDMTFKHLVLVGGSAEALYSVYSDYYSIPDTEHRVMKKKKLNKLVKHLISSEERSLLFIKNAPDSVHTIIPAALLIQAVSKQYSSEEYIVSGSGVKEGYLCMIAEDLND